MALTLFSLSSISAATISLSQIPLGKVVSINNHKLVKVSPTQYMALQPTSCPTGRYIADVGCGACSSAITGCSACSSASVCTTCTSGYIKGGNTCKTCATAVAHCSSCNGTTCTACSSGYTLSGGACVASEVLLGQSDSAGDANFVVPSGINVVRIDATMNMAAGGQSVRSGYIGVTSGKTYDLVILESWNGPAEGMIYTSVANPLSASVMRWAGPVVLYGSQGSSIASFKIYYGSSINEQTPDVTDY